MERTDRTVKIESVEVRSLDRPDEHIELTKGTLDIVSAGGQTVGRATYEPGWRWSEHVGRAQGQVSCTVAHVVLVLAGKMRIAMDDGDTFDVGPGDLCAIPSGHDAWVLGDERYVSLHFTGAEAYAEGTGA